MMIDEGARITAIVTGVFLILISLGVLLSILKKVPVQ